jgi:hypothetical protein
MKKNLITRRNFLMAAAVTPVAGAIGCCCGARAAAGTSTSPGGVARMREVAHMSRVVLVRDAAAVGEGCKLNIQVMLTPQFHNIGPRGFSEAYLWPFKGLIVGQDVVAVDSTAYRVIQAQRLKHCGEDKSLETSAHHIALADTRHKLGTSDPNLIDLVKLGWQEGILI